MKKLIVFAFLFSTSSLFIGCGSESGAENSANKAPNYDEMAQELCKCMTPLMDVQKKIEALSAEGKTEEIQAMLIEVEALTKAGDQCVGALEAKYGEVKEQEEEKASAAFQKACPEIAAMLDEE